MVVLSGLLTVEETKMAVHFTGLIIDVTEKPFLDSSKLLV